MTVLGLGLAGVCGLALGSFATTAGLRAAQGGSALRGRSRCDACRRTLGFAETLPVLSYIWRAGRCGACAAPINPLHLAGEVAGALVLGAAFAFAPPLNAVLTTALGLLLIALSAADWTAKRLPDPLTAAVAVVAVVLAWQRSQIVAGLCAAALAVGALLLLRGLATGKDGEPGLGQGDVKLIAALALWLGAATPWMATGAAILGLGAMAVARPADGRLPFGPMISGAALAIGLAREGGFWPVI